MVRSTVRLLLMLLGLLPIGSAQATPAEGTAMHGGDLPPSGRSLFDLVLARDDRGEVQVPFPFTALLQRIAPHLDTAEPFGGLPVVLIPLGRSLQRHAAGDVEAFRYPRVVAAATGEPPPNAPPHHLYLKDRLYVAYQESASTLEVISYNEADARFEFQLVRNYRAGATPELGYANRPLCLACHHNAAPIFSRQSWDETSASPPVLQRLAATGLPYYGLRWRHGVDVPDAIDAATVRANLLATTQHLWRDGCAMATRAAAIACRAEALRLALRYRLGGSRAIALDTPPAPDHLVRPLLARWQQRWPDGLEVPDPQIPNRQPFAAIAEGTRAPDDTELPRFADVSAAFDPLALRPPLERWRGRGDADVGRFIHALSMFFSRTDIDRLDQQLSVARDAPVQNLPARELDFACTERERAGTRLDLDCSATDGGRMQARIGLQHRRMTGGTIDRLVMPGNDSVGALELTPIDAHDAHGLHTMRFQLGRAGRTVRAVSGEAIRQLSLTRAADDTTARATLHLAADLGALDRAIDALAHATLAGHSDALDVAPLRRSAVMPAILGSLGVADPLQPSTALAPARLAEPIAPRAQPWPPDLLAFVRNCSQCHATAAEFPPGFLHGDDNEVRRHLAACAERMVYRLEMNHLAPAARPKTPMPPPAAAHAAGFARSTDLAAMRDMLERMLEARATRSATVLGRPYATLAPCTAARNRAQETAP